MLLAPLVLGDAPAPFWACDGKRPGARCRKYGVSSCFSRSEDGVCVVQTNCKDDPSTPIDECLWCQ